MPAIAIKLDRLAGAFARRTAILTIRLRGAGTARVPTLVLISLVRHL